MFVDDLMGCLTLMASQFTSGAAARRGKESQRLGEDDGETAADDHELDAGKTDSHSHDQPEVRVTTISDGDSACCCCSSSSSSLSSLPSSLPCQSANHAAIE